MGKMHHNALHAFEIDKKKFQFFGKNAEVDWDQSYTEYTVYATSINFFTEEVAYSF